MQCPVSSRVIAQIRYWLYKENFCFPWQLLISLFPRTSETFRTLRENFISDRLSIITKEQKYELTGYCDNVSTIVSRRKRQKCEENTPKSKVKADVYNFVTHHHDGPPQIVVGNPISKNPCSYDAVKDVLLQIKNDVGISNHRSWSIVGCDGLPYVIASRVIKETADLQDILLQPGLGHWEMNMAKGVIISITFRSINNKCLVFIMI